MTFGADGLAAAALGAAARSVYVRQLFTEPTVIAATVSDSVIDSPPPTSILIQDVQAAPLLPLDTISLLSKDQRVTMLTRPGNKSILKSET